MSHRARGRRRTLLAGTFLLGVGAACSPAEDPPPADDPDDVQAPALPVEEEEPAEPSPAPGDPPPPEPEPSEGPPAATDPVGAPPTVVDTLWIRGSPEETTLDLYESPAVFPLPFRTYLPRGMAVEELGTGEGYAIRFLLDRTPRPEGSPLAEIFVFHEEVSGERVRETLESRAENLGDGDLEEGPVLPWARESFAFEGTRRVGWLARGEAGGRPFLWSVHYPADLREDFEPRVAEILRRWRWTDEDRAFRDPLP